MFLSLNSLQPSIFQVLCQFSGVCPIQIRNNNTFAKVMIDPLNRTMLPKCLGWQVCHGLSGARIEIACINRHQTYPPGNDHISPTKALWKMVFLFPRWDVLVSWRMQPLCWFGVCLRKSYCLMNAFPAKRLDIQDVHNLENPWNEL